MAMIEENGQVVASDGDFIWVQTQPRSTCGHCHVGSDCGTSVVAKMFGQRSNRIRVHNALGLQVGEGAVVGIHESALLKASLLAYLLPLFAMVAAAVFAATLDVSDGGVALASVAGLGLGLMLLQGLGFTRQGGAYQVSLLRKAPGVNHLFTVEVQRGTTL